MKMPSETVIRVSQEGLAALAALVARMEAAAERMERATGGAHPAPAEEPLRGAVEPVVANVAYGDSLVTEEAIRRRVADVVAEARGAGPSDDSHASPGGPAPGTGGAK